MPGPPSATGRLASARPAVRRDCDPRRAAPGPPWARRQRARTPRRQRARTRADSLPGPRRGGSLQADWRGCPGRARRLAPRRDGPPKQRIGTARCAQPGPQPAPRGAMKHGPLDRSPRLGRAARRGALARRRPAPPDRRGQAAVPRVRRQARRAGVRAFLDRHQRPGSRPANGRVDRAGRARSSRNRRAARASPRAPT